MSKDVTIIGTGTLFSTMAPQSYAPSTEHPEGSLWLPLAVAFSCLVVAAWPEATLVRRAERDLQVLCAGDAACKTAVTHHAARCSEGSVSGGLVEVSSLATCVEEKSGVQWFSSEDAPRTPAAEEHARQHAKPSPMLSNTKGS